MSVGKPYTNEPSWYCAMFQKMERSIMNAVMFVEYFFNFNRL